MSVTDRYGWLDRLLHRLAFDLPFVQKSLSEMENDVYAREMAAMRPERPVFIAGLPRSGTTLLLELLYGTGEFATFTYRQMPFVLAPLVWSRLSAPFQRGAASRERSHGDGMRISFDSPEAFEEVLWLTYLHDRIVGPFMLRPLPPDAVPDAFAGLFRQLVRKLVLLRRQRAGGGSYRYLSKNNANVARLAALRAIFPDAVVLVPFRDPLAHARSLMSQHGRFLSLHAADGFSRKYMRWIGHYEFGADFKPIDFDGSGGEALRLDSLDADYWVGYWTRAYRHVLDHAGAGIHLVDFDGLLRDPDSLGRIGRTAGVVDGERLAAASAGLRAPTSVPLAAASVSPDILAAARALHETLRSRALCAG